MRIYNSRFGNNYYVRGAKTARFLKNVIRKCKGLVRYNSVPFDVRESASVGDF